jgi:hypothetical protein
MTLKMGDRIVVCGGENHYRGATGTIVYEDTKGSKFDFVVEIDGSSLPVVFYAHELTSLPNQ